jgi:8-oxo-dGTP pyrophosphatase MutT (NUDIX family)
MKREHLLELFNNYQIKYSSENISDINDFVLSDNNFWKSSNQIGHITASCWVISSDYNNVLMTHHYKLNKWIQLGGHIESYDEDIFSASQRELKEESGLTRFELVSKSIFDIDIHEIPKRNDSPCHLHYDIRILFIADNKEEIKFDRNESNSVKWFKLDEIESFNNESSIIRLVNKTKTLFNL